MYPDDATDPETLVKYADTAMVRAKQAGRDGYRFFTAGMNVQVLARLDMELALRRAIDNNELLLHYQPKVNLNTGAIAASRRCCAGSGRASAWSSRPTSCRCSKIPA
jgi:predicted signal transduction protein with EAL and GGDEF domain